MLRVTEARLGVSLVSVKTIRVTWQTRLFVKSFYYVLFWSRFKPENLRTMRRTDLKELCSACQVDENPR